MKNTITQHLKNKSFYLIGIGGAGMMGIAELLHNLGFIVHGSDIADSSSITRLRKLKIKIYIGHDSSKIKPNDIIIYSNAIKANNVEIKYARKKGMTILTRMEILSELMRLKYGISITGSHGKTTTTSLVATILETAGYDPTVINGGIIQGWGSNARLGLGDWMVVEADESDGSFSKLNPTVAVVTNIDPEHLDYHGSYENLERAFTNFVGAIPFYGFASVCIDHPSVQRLLPTIMDRRIITFGLASNADVRASNVHAKDQKMHL